MSKSARNILFISICVGLFMYAMSCQKSSPGYYSCSDLPPAKDSAALLQFASNHGITASLDTTGLYFQIIDTGTGSKPVSTSKIYVSYTAELMDGTIFDSVSNALNTGWVLNQLIYGWQIGLPKIREGGRIKLLVPSMFGYGCNGSGDGRVPKDAPLYFDVTLVSVGQ